MANEGLTAPTTEIGPKCRCLRGPRTTQLLPLTSPQRSALLGFLIVSAIDVVLSVALFFGGGGGYVEANPVLAWASEGLLLFLVTVLAVKAIGAGMLALLTSFANRFCTLAGDAVLLAALGTTTALFLLELITVGAVPAPISPGLLTGLG